MIHHKKTKVELFSEGIDHDLDGRCVLMQAHGIRKAFDGNQVLKDVSFDLKEGEVVLLRGDNGSGKTTLLNLLTGNMEPDEGVIHLDIDGTSETFDFPRRWWQNLNPFDHFTPERVANEAVGRTWQGVRLFSTQSLIDNIAVATASQPGENPLKSVLYRRHSQNIEKENRKESSNLLSALGLKKRSDSSADKISLGQTKRVAIARAIRAGARILFLDEPLDGLDKNGIEEIMVLLTDLAQNEKVTLVIIEHVFNIQRVLDLAHTVWTLNDGHITTKTVSDVHAHLMKNPSNAAMGLLNSIAGSDTSVVEQKITGNARLTRFVKLETKIQPPVVLEINNLIVRRGHRLVIGQQATNGAVVGLNLTIYQGEITVLQAPNGWGKTTLMEAIAGILPIEQGEIRFNGVLVNSLPIWERIRLGISILHSRNSYFKSLTVSEVFDLSSSSLNNLCLADGIFNNKVSSLSSGERQKVCLACLRPSQFVIYDEPFSALDAASLKSDILPSTGTSLILLPVDVNGNKSQEAKYPNEVLDQANSQEKQKKTEKIIPSRTLKLWNKLNSSDSKNLPMLSLSPWITKATGSLKSHAEVAPMLPSTICMLEYLTCTPPLLLNVLDFGCGSGILAVAAGLLGAETVDAIDVNPNAINATKDAIQKLASGKSIKVFESEGFRDIDRKYDLILANIPIVDSLPPSNKNIDPYGLFDPDWNLHCHFKNEFKRFLQNEGIALVCHAELQDHWSFVDFESFMKKDQCNCEVVHETTIEKILWRIYKITPSNK